MSTQLLPGGGLGLKCPGREDAPVAAGSSGRARMPNVLRPGVRRKRRAMLLAISRDAAAGMARLGGHVCSSRCLAECALPADPAHSSRMFRATNDQVRVVRAFVRARLADHPARDDAVLVASEIGANTVAYSASGRDGGVFLVHVAEVSATHAAVLICERRGPGQPATRNARKGSESGRGLAVVKSLSWFFLVHDGKSSVRTILAVVPADPSEGAALRFVGSAGRKP